MKNLNQLLNNSINTSVEIEALLNKSLMKPLCDFFQYSGKNIRPRLIKIGYLLSHQKEPELTSEVESKILLASAVIEMIHGGSLIIDDIQDGSLTRRNGPSLHSKHGVPLALNAGNWLYFNALTSLKNLNLDSLTSTWLIHEILDLMLKAHYGQALDLGVNVFDLNQSMVKETSLTSMKLKTGSITTLALYLGLGIGGNPSRLNLMKDLGERLGLALQMYDDFANFYVANVADSSKRHEDLYNKRPTWIWAVVSTLNTESYRSFKEAVLDLPSEEKLKQWCESHSFVDLLWQQITEYFLEVQKSWTDLWGEEHPLALGLLNELKEMMENSYVKKY